MRFYRLFLTVSLLALLEVSPRFAYTAEPADPPNGSEATSTDSKIKLAQELLKLVEDFRTKQQREPTHDELTQAYNSGHPPQDHIVRWKATEALNLIGAGKLNTAEIAERSKRVVALAQKYPNAKNDDELGTLYSTEYNTKPLTGKQVSEAFLASGIRRKEARTAEKAALPDEIRTLMQGMENPTRQKLIDAYHAKYPDRKKPSRKEVSKALHDAGIILKEPRRAAITKEDEHNVLALYYENPELSDEKLGLLYGDFYGEEPLRPATIGRILRNADIRRQREVDLIELAGRGDLLVKLLTESPELAKNHTQLGILYGQQQCNGKPCPTLSKEEVSHALIKKGVYTGTPHDKRELAGRTGTLKGIRRQESRAPYRRVGDAYGHAAGTSLSDDTASRTLRHAGHEERIFLSEAQIAKLRELAENNSTLPYSEIGKLFAPFNNGRVFSETQVILVLRRHGGVTRRKDQRTERLAKAQEVVHIEAELRERLKRQPTQREIANEYNQRHEGANMKQPEVSGLLELAKRQEQK